MKIEYFDAGGKCRVEYTYKDAFGKEITIPLNEVGPYGTLDVQLTTSHIIVTIDFYGDGSRVYVNRHFTSYAVRDLIQDWSNMIADFSGFS